MKLDHLYSLRLTYRELWDVGDERFGIMEGRCEGRVAGAFVGANRARIRADGGYLPHVHGVVETDDGGRLLVELRGRGRMDAGGNFSATASVTHASDDPRYAHLNDVVCAVEASSPADAEGIALDVYEIVGGAAPS